MQKIRGRRKFGFFIVGGLAFVKGLHLLSTLPTPETVGSLSNLFACHRHLISRRLIATSPSVPLLSVEVEQGGRSKVVPGNERLFR